MAERLDTLFAPGVRYVPVTPHIYALLRAYEAGWRYRLGLYWRWGSWPKSRKGIDKLFAPKVTDGKAASV